MIKIYTQEIAESLAKSIESFEIKATEKDYIIKDVVMTTNDTDRHNEVVLQDGIDLTEFKKNPVALIDHNYSLEAVAWVWENIRKEDGKHVADCRIIDTPAGALVRKLHEAGAIKDVSIGFIAHERQGNVITKAELIECSFVVVGSNRGAKVKELLGVEYQTLKDSGVIKEEEEVVPETIEKRVEQIQSDITAIKSLLTELVDGKTMSVEALDKKEQIQAIARIANEVLRDFKRA